MIMILRLKQVLIASQRRSVATMHGSLPFLREGRAEAAAASPVCIIQLCNLLFSTHHASHHRCHSPPHRTISETAPPAPPPSPLDH